MNNSMEKILYVGDSVIKRFSDSTSYLVGVIQSISLVEDKLVYGIKINEDFMILTDEYLLSHYYGEFGKNMLRKQKDKLEKQVESLTMLYESQSKRIKELEEENQQLENDKEIWISRWEYERGDAYELFQKVETQDAIIEKFIKIASELDTESSWIRIFKDYKGNNHCNLTDAKIISIEDIPEDSEL